MWDGAKLGGWASDKMPPGCIPGRTNWEETPGQTQNWRDYISHLALESIRIPWEELENVLEIRSSKLPCLACDIVTWLWLAEKEWMDEWLLWVGIKLLVWRSSSVWWPGSWMRIENGAWDAQVILGQRQKQCWHSTRPLWWRGSWAGRQSFGFTSRSFQPSPVTASVG